MWIAIGFAWLAAAAILLVTPKPASPRSTYIHSVDTIHGSMWMRFDSGWEKVKPLLLQMKLGHPRIASTTNRAEAPNRKQR
jgi:hypothetical protein